MTDCSTHEHTVTNSLYEEPHEQMLCCEPDFWEVDGEDQSAILIMSYKRTLELAAAVVESPRTECALKRLVLNTRGLQ